MDQFAEAPKPLGDHQPVDRYLYFSCENDPQYQSDRRRRRGPDREGGSVIVSNHFSYVDRIVLGSIFPVVFVSKREVKKWPLIGLWTSLCGTIFINRQREDQVRLLIVEMIRKLNEGVNILLFPEGRATNGERMLPFQSAPLAAPLRNRSIIVPVTLVYNCVDDKPVSKQNRDLI